MADIDGIKEVKEFYLDVDVKVEKFHVKGSNSLGWGMKTRLSNIFNPKSGKTVMLAFDHGYIMGATQGLERLDITIPPLVEHADVLMATRGALRTCIEPNHNKAVALRSTAGSTVLRDDLSSEIIGVDIEEAIRLNASCMAVQVYLGSENETGNIKNLVQTVDLGNRYGIPVLGVVAVGKEMERTPQFFLTATRTLAELGAHIIKTYYCDDFEKIVAACPVPLVVAGGKKIPEYDALTLVYDAIKAGAAGVDMGRNVFQSEKPTAMIQAVCAVVHDGMSVDEAYELYKKL